MGRVGGEDGIFERGEGLREEEVGSVFGRGGAGVGVCVLCVCCVVVVKTVGWWVWLVVM